MLQTKPSDHTYPSQLTRPTLAPSLTPAQQFHNETQIFALAKLQILIAVNFQDSSKTMEIIYLKTTNTKILFSGKLQTFQVFTKSFFSWSWDYSLNFFQDNIIPDSQTNLIIKGRMR